MEDHDDDDDDIPCPQSKCECNEETEHERTICFVEGSEADQGIAEDTTELADMVWFGVKPPIDMDKMNPFVSARQLEICRAQLTGKVKPKEDLVVFPPGANVKQSAKTKKSAVRFISTTAVSH